MKVIMSGRDPIDSGSGSDAHAVAGKSTQNDVASGAQSGQDQSQPGAGSTSKGKRALQVEDAAHERQVQRAKQQKTRHVAEGEEPTDDDGDDDDDDDDDEDDEDVSAVWIKYLELQAQTCKHDYDLEVARVELARFKIQKKFELKKMRLEIEKLKVQQSIEAGAAAMAEHRLNMQIISA